MFLNSPSRTITLINSIAVVIDISRIETFLFIHEWSLIEVDVYDINGDNIAKGKNVANVAKKSR